MLNGSDFELKLFLEAIGSLQMMETVEILYEGDK